MDCRSGARGRLFAPAPRGPGGCCRRGRRCFRRLIGNCRALCQDRHGHVMWVSQEAAFRSTDNWKDTTIIKQAVSCSAVLGLDVGKSSLGVPRHEAGRGPRQRARRQPRGGPRRPVLPGRGGHPGRRRPDPKHRLPGHQARQARRASRSLTCPESQPTGPRSCSPETSRPTSATPW